METITGTSRAILTRYKDNDIVLLWQPHPDENKRGIYAWGIINGNPYLAPDSQSDWKVKITRIQILSRHLSKRAICDAGMPELLDLQVILTPRGRIFPVTAVQWAALQRLRPELGGTPVTVLDRNLNRSSPARGRHNRRTNWTHCSYVFAAAAIVALVVSVVLRATIVHEKALEPFSGEDRP